MESPLDHPSALHIPIPAPGAYPARPGNLVRPLVAPVAAFRQIGEAIMAAQYSIWLTVAFYAPDFHFPDGMGTLFDVLDKAAIRGLDVRVLFWRPNEQSNRYGRAFAGTKADRALLCVRGSRFSIRWDQAYAGYCQHQKSWIIDAGQPTETAFIGGVNLTAQALSRHDLYVEVTGQSATDVHHNFVQRWNEASERVTADGGWGPANQKPLPFPIRASGSKGPSVVAIQRMIHPGLYSDNWPAPGCSLYDIAAGETSIFRQYLEAIKAARSSIYLENQALPISPIARNLEDALRRGVEVVLLVPAEPEAWVRAARRDPSRTALFGCVEALGRYDNFAMVGFTIQEGDRRRPVYVHSKAMLVDDAWATIGSCNLHANSLNGHTEMNASIWDAKVVRTLRCDLLAGHLGRDTSGIDDRDAMQLVRKTAQRNSITSTAWQGSIFALKASEYEG